jgi:Fe2+ or Zn2+ uptake regulation protein
VRCGRVDDVFAPPLDLVGGMTNDMHGYQIVGHRLEFLGVCPACQKQSDDGGRDERSTWPRNNDK